MVVGVVVAREEGRGLGGLEEGIGLVGGRRGSRFGWDHVVRR